MRLLIIILGIVTFLLLVFLAALYILYRKTFYSPLKWQLDENKQFNSKAFSKYKDRAESLIQSLKNKPCEDIYCTSYDGLKLHARLFENKKSNKIAIMFHGYRGRAYRDFCGGAKEVMELGYTAILVDQRAHGQSEGHSITFGIRESKDVVSWLDYAKKRFGEGREYILVGISMGGATVLNAADKVGDNIKIIADCPFTSPKSIIVETLKRMKLSPAIFYPIVNLCGILFAHTNMNRVLSFEAIKNTNNKILIIHGDDDHVVPHQISHALYEKYPDKIRYELFHDADHGVSYMVDTERYKKIVSDFLM